MDINFQNKSKQISGVANYWLVWFIFIFALCFIYDSKQPLWLLIPATLCVPVGNPFIKYLEVKYGSKNDKMAK